MKDAEGSVRFRMARVGFILSMLLTMLGVVLLSVGLLVRALAPVIGRAAFQIGGGSYSPTMYEPGNALWLHHALAVACLIVGALLSALCWRRAHALTGHFPLDD